MKSGDIIGVGPAAVIIGAGPAGLYLAIKLYKAGLRNIVVYDPRAGNYTRPGHLNPDVFAKAENGIGVDFWPAFKTGHIKDLEKKLYEEAIKLGIKIENKRFVNFTQKGKKSGVIIVDSENNEEIIETNYVFDCTGTRRNVISAVNNLIPESPLQLTTITDLPIENHFLAYVKISKTDWDKFKDQKSLIAHDLETIAPISYVDSIIKLRNLGWNEFNLPRCYGQSFNKDKICLYMHAPQNLAKENHESWVQTVLESYSKSITYVRLPSNSKPRFVAFPCKAQALKEVAYKGKNLPMVIAMGDAQIDFDYVLAHGIKDGMGRIDAFIDHIEILNNSIEYFDCDDYMRAIKKSNDTHKEDMIEGAMKVKRSFENCLDIAERQFKESLLQCNDEDKKIIYQNFLDEIIARKLFVNAQKSFYECHDQNKQLKVNSASLIKLNESQEKLIKAIIGLTKNSQEYNSCIDLLLNLAMSCKQYGNNLFNNRKLSEAINAYKAAIDIYEMVQFAGKYSAELLPLYSNLVIVYLQNKMYKEAVETGKIGLSIYDKCEDKEKVVSLCQKIVVNSRKAMDQMVINLLKDEDKNINNNLSSFGLFKPTDQNNNLGDGNKTQFKY